MKQMSFVAAVGLALGLHAAVAASQTATALARPSEHKKDVTITGCVVKGDGGYVLTNVAEATTEAALAGGLPDTPQPPGTVMPGRVLYWVDNDDLEKHAGQKVEVRGELEREITTGKVSAEREGGLVELEFKVDGEKKVTVRVPNVPAAVGTSGAVGDKERDFPYIVRKIDVDKVKMIMSTCQ